MITLICGLRRQRGEAAGLADLFAALPRTSGAADREWSDGRVALGCRHRGSADISRWPPLADQESGLAVTASARLDGREELCDALAIPRAGEPDLSDGELVLRAWRRWGRACPQHLLGDFAFAVWDARRGSLFCARDHIGAKPFYYAATPSGFAFASEIAAVLAAPEVDSSFDEATVTQWLSPLSFRNHPATERTFYRAVRRLLPGHSLTVDRSGVRVERWWRPEEAPAVAPASDDECAEAFLALYARAVRDCLRAPDPIGTHLSGGLDSSGVAVLAARELRRQGRPPPHLFSWQPPPAANRDAFEYKLIDSVCRQEEMVPIWCPLSAKEVVAFFRNDVTLGQTVTTVMREAVVRRSAEERGVKVILSGWGGDEAASFNGRGYYPELLLQGRLVRLWREVSARSRHPLAHILVRVALPLVFRPAAALLRRPALPSPSWPDWAAQIWTLGMRSTSVRRVQLDLLLQGSIGERAEGWAEAGWRCGVEYRYPLLDRRLLRFALGLPPDLYRRGPWSRWIMRHALRSVLPGEVLWHRRKDEPVAIEARNRAVVEATPEIRRLLASRSAPSARSSYLDMDGLMESLESREFPDSIAPARALRFLDFQV